MPLITRLLEILYISIDGTGKRKILPSGKCFTPGSCLSGILIQGNEYFVKQNRPQIFCRLFHYLKRFRRKVGYARNKKKSHPLAQLEMKQFNLKALKMPGNVNEDRTTSKRDYDSQA